MIPTVQIRLIIYTYISYVYTCYTHISRELLTVSSRHTKKGSMKNKETQKVFTCKYYIPIKIGCVHLQ